MTPAVGPPPAPARAVVAAFTRTAGARTAHLPGGGGTSWRVGALVLKPVGSAAEAVEVAWLAEHLPRDADVGRGLRLADAVAAGDGRWVVDGWRAARWVEGAAGPAGPWPPLRWREVLGAADAFSAAVAHLPRPAWLDGRDHPWAAADRAAWALGGAPTDGLERPAERLGELLRRLEELAGATGDDVGGADGGADGGAGGERSQLVHGDVTGNALLAPRRAPAVIDVSPYWRPPAWSRAVVVADGLLWHGAGAPLVDLGATGAPLVARALLFRLLVDAATSPAGGPPVALLERYERSAAVAAAAGSTAGTGQAVGTTSASSAST